MPTVSVGKQTATVEGLALSLTELRARIEQRRDHAWQPNPGDTAQERKKHWQAVAEQRAQKVEAGAYIGDELLPQLRGSKAMTSIGREFLKAAERGNARMVGAFIEEGFPVNYQDRETEETALHVTAATRARNALRVLLSCGLCNFLLRDKRGRLASEMAYLFGRDPAAARLLRVKERKQAAANGIKLTRRPEPRS
jgi:hypothetical protein